MTELDFQTLFPKTNGLIFFFIQDLNRQIATCKKKRSRSLSLNQVYHKRKMPKFVTDFDFPYYSNSI